MVKQAESGKTFLMPRSGERLLWAVTELSRRRLLTVYGSTAALPTPNEAHLMAHEAN